MKRMIPVAIMSAFVCPLAFAGDSADELTREALKQMGKVADVLETIKDKQTAADATPKLRELAKTLADLKKKIDKVKPSKDEQKELESKYKKQFDAILQRMLKETTRLSKVEGGPEALRELEKAK